NQKLHLFLKVFQDLVWKNEYNENTRKKARHYFFVLGKSQTMSTLYRQMLVQLRDEITEKKRLDIITQMADHKIISPYSHQEADLFIMFGSSLQYNAYGILLRIPYLNLLDDLKQKNMEYFIQEDIDWV
ncbi:MAG: hypothetical protein L3J12_01220, partial [Spirochaetales bacterium]|nr:hypothetical protein [Spirochaetales bacterium]